MHSPTTIGKFSGNHSPTPTLLNLSHRKFIQKTALNFTRTSWNPDTIDIGLSKGGLTKDCLYGMLITRWYMKIEINQLTCQRCAHKWFPRSTEVVICPHCKSPYWDKKKHRISKTVTVNTEKGVEVVYVPDEGNV